MTEKSREEGRELPEYVSRLKDGAWRLDLQVQPRAKSSSVAGVQGGRLKLKIAAPAVDNKANEALTAYISGLLGLRRSQVLLLSGQTSRQKSVRIESESEPPWPRLAPDQGASS